MMGAVPYRLVVLDGGRAHGFIPQKEEEGADLHLVQHSNTKVAQEAEPSQ